MAGEDMLIPKFGIRGGIVILGGFIIHLALGSYYMFGNYSPYIVSYLRNRTSETEVRNVDALWVTSFGNIGNIIGMVVGGLLDRKYGPRKATAVGSLIFCSSVMVTYFCVEVNLALVTLTYGFTSNLGNFMAYIPPVQAAMKWLPKRTTLAAGLIVCGFGGGTLIFSQVLTAYINPDNLSPDQHVSDDEKYFTQEDLLDRVPKSFLLLGGIYLIMQIIGIACLTNPPATEISVQGPTDNSYEVGQKGGVKTNEPTNEPGYYSETSPLVDPPKPVHKPVLEVIKEALSVRATYILWLTILCNMFAMQFVDTVYKAYGQNFISDDKFLALSVAISSLFNSIGRPIWGLINDRFGYKVTMCGITGGFAVVLGTFSLTEDMGKAAFMIWLCLMFLFYCGVWAVMPATFAALFGTENTGITFGLTGLATAIAAITSGVSGVTLKADLGWHGLFYLCAGIVAIAFLITFLFNGRNRRGEKI